MRLTLPEIHHQDPHYEEENEDYSSILFTRQDAIEQRAANGSCKNKGG
jgi:hypothetical protein